MLIVFLLRLTAITNYIAYKSNSNLRSINCDETGWYAQQTSMLMLLDLTEVAGVEIIAYDMTKAFDKFDHAAIVALTIA